MSHPRAEVDPGVRGRGGKRQRQREEVVPRKTDSKEGDNSHSEVHGNPEEQEEEDKDLTRAQM